MSPFNTIEAVRSLPRFTGTAQEQRWQFVKRLVRQPPDFEPGTRSQYSNAGYAIAGTMAERMARKSWEALVEEDFMRPLGSQLDESGTPVVDQDRGFVVCTNVSGSGVGESVDSILDICERGMRGS